MSAVVIPMRCERCGRPVEPTPAALAAGGSHPACVLPTALTASAAGIDVDALILSRWALRLSAARSARAGRQSPTPSSSRPIAITAATTPKLGSPLRRPPQPLGRVEIVSRMLGVVGTFSRRPSAVEVQRRARRDMGQANTATAWNLLVTSGALAVSVRRGDVARISRIDHDAADRLLEQLRRNPETRQQP